MVFVRSRASRFRGLCPFSKAPKRAADGSLDAALESPNFAAMRPVGPEKSLSFQDKEARPHTSVSEAQE
jgi:hypothetical protein